MKIRRRIIVSGKVQGVFYRDTCREVANAEGVSGYANNLFDGRVEVVLEGESGAVKRVTEWCKRGTKFSVIKNIEIIEEEDIAGETGFYIR